MRTILRNTLGKTQPVDLETILVLLSGAAAAKTIDAVRYYRSNKFYRTLYNKDGVAAEYHIEDTFAEEALLKAGFTYKPKEIPTERYI